MIEEVKTRFNLNCVTAQFNLVRFNLKFNLSLVEIGLISDSDFEILRFRFTLGFDFGLAGLLQKYERAEELQWF